ncbi:AzlC family ABC transporter permease [Ferruginivarius sediminum]|nr:AzlC family ABC transporter permease [Ferruginivarius sediminum]
MSVQSQAVSARLRVSQALGRAVPVGIALFPVGMLFGVLADQVNWRAHELLVMGVLAFTGSGQFAFLRFIQEDVGYPVIFFIILCMNLRYIPMSLSASRPLKLKALPKAAMAHCVSDESYAAESREDDVTQRLAVRLTIVAAWTGSTVVGVLAAGLIPETLRPYFIGLTFPISALLFMLSAFNVVAFLKPNEGWPVTGRVAAVAAGIAIALVLMAVLGMRYFWIPSIAVSFGILSYVWEKSQ